MKTCPECESKDLLEDSERGETVCAHCGAVVEEYLPDAKEQHFPNRRSATHTHARKSYTQLSRQLQQASARAGVNKSWFQKQLKIATRELDIFSSKLNVPKSVKEQAKNLHQSFKTEAYTRKTAYRNDSGKSCIGMQAHQSTNTIDYHCPSD